MPIAQRPGKRGPIPKPLEERFWSKVLILGEDDCWPWHGLKDKSGYGRFRVGSLADGTRTMKLAHRVAFELIIGPIPLSLDGLHSCDNPPCCNPAHVFIGDHADNDRDRDAKGRMVPPPHYRGEQNPAAKLTYALADEIRERFAKGESQSAIGRSLGLNHSTIGYVVRGIRWIRLTQA